MRSRLQLIIYYLNLATESAEESPFEYAVWDELTTTVCRMEKLQRKIESEIVDSACELAEDSEEE